MREKIEELIEKTQERVKWGKAEVLKRLGIGKTQQTMFRKPFKRFLRPLKRKNNLTLEEKDAAIKYCFEHRGVWYVKLSYMLLDAGIAYIPPSTLYLLLKIAGYFASRLFKSSDADKEYLSKPACVHDMWHTDIAYVILSGITYYLIVLLDGFSRFVLNWELLYNMRANTVSDFAQKTLDKYPEAKDKVRIVQDNGSCYISADYRAVLKKNGAIWIHTKRNHPETNGKAEALIKITRNEGIRPAAPQIYEEAKNTIAGFFEYYNNERLHSGIGFMRPVDLFYGRQEEVKRQREETKARFIALRKQRNEEFNTMILNQAGYTPILPM